MSGDTLSSQAEQVRRRAADLAAGLSRTARRSTTIAQERAVLRMLGVDGLDRDGRPLAASLAERYCGADTRRLASGVILPFVVAMLEYDMGPRELALDGASGAIDLGLEAELLERPDRRAAAEKRAAELLAAALVRFDENRTATREMREVLGSRGEPWLGVALQATEVKAAATETRGLVCGGADVVQVRVPASWEFAEARRQAGLDTPGVFEVRRGDGRRRSQPLRPAAEPVPAGSQRGLASLRKAADDAAAERGAYAGLMTVTSAFAAPEQAVVAAFERIDLVEADPIRDIVEDNVDPERALADHAFAHRLQVRAGCRVVMGAGALALGADVASGVPANETTRAGIGLALQALGVELALAGGLTVDRLLLGAVPVWVTSQGDVQAVLVQAWLRRATFPGHRLVLADPAADVSLATRAAVLVAALATSDASLVVRDGVSAQVDEAARDLHAAARSAAVLRASLGDGSLRGDAAELAGRTLRAANEALERLAAEGWSSLLGPRSGQNGPEALGSRAVVERLSGPATSDPVLASLT